MLVVSMRTLLSILSDEIRDELLPLNPLIKEMSLIKDKPLTKWQEKLQYKTLYYLYYIQACSEMLKYDRLYPLETFSFHLIS